MTTKYVVRHSGLTYPADPDIVRRLLAGENIPIPERGLKEVGEGDIVDDIPACSLAALIDKGYVEALPEHGPGSRGGGRRTQTEADEPEEGETDDPEEVPE